MSNDSAVEIRYPTAAQAAWMERSGVIMEEYRNAPGLHFCYEWDEMLIWPGLPEFNACQCGYGDEIKIIHNKRRI